jgi:hypothetical protein
MVWKVPIRFHPLHHAGRLRERARKSPELSLGPRAEADAELPPRARGLKKHRGQPVPECVQPYSASLPRNPQFIHDWVENRLDHFVPAVGAIPTIHKQKLLLVIYEVCSQLLANEWRRRDAVL